MTNLKTMLADRAQRILAWLSLKPYGQQLCTEAASMWVTSARLLVIVMASAEALSWGYLGYFVGAPQFSVPAALFAALSIMVLVWVVDSSFMTLDSSSTLRGTKWSQAVDSIRSDPRCREILVTRVFAKN